MQHLSLSFAYSHFVKPHLGLRQKTKKKKTQYRERTPMMAAGITDHRWAMVELFSAQWMARPGRARLHQKESAKLSASAGRAR